MASLKPAGDIYEILSRTERGGKEEKENKMKKMRNNQDAFSGRKQALETYRKNIYKVMT